MTTGEASSSATKRMPYIMTFVGVNGVGKSTNLSKVCFWLLQNDLRVLIAACDTFRSGAVEQLRVHVRNLGMLAVGDKQGSDSIELYEKGYGKDAAGIAKEAIAYGEAVKRRNSQIILTSLQRRRMLLTWFLLTPLGACKIMRYETFPSVNTMLTPCYYSLSCAPLPRLLFTLRKYLPASKC